MIQTVAPPTVGVPDPARQSIKGARRAQAEWAAVPFAQRRQILRRFRYRMVQRLDELAAALHHLPRTPAESLTSEVMPLLAAARFLQQRGAAALRPQRLQAGGSRLWFGRSTLHLAHRPLGVVLIIGPANYPLFLPAAQTIHALFAGNAVLLKPGIAGSPVAEIVSAALYESGIPNDLLQTLPEDPTHLSAFYDAGVDHVVFTGSAATGQKILADLAPYAIPATMELSGHDAAIILPGADLERTIRCLTFALHLNAGNTCIVPRCVIAPATILAALQQRLGPALARIDSRTAAPLLGISAETDVDLVHSANNSAYGLGASIFGPPAAACRIAAQLHVGVVTINDLIVPTADPAVPFGGCKQSGFGVTRGIAGLRAMTCPVTTIIRHGRWLPHLDPPHPNDAELFAAFLAAQHSLRFTDRLAAWRRAFTQLLRRRRTRRSSKKRFQNVSL